MGEPDDDDLIHGLKLAATAVAAAVVTATVVIGGGQTLAPSLFSAAPDAPQANVVRVAGR